MRAVALRGPNEGSLGLNRCKECLQSHLTVRALAALLIPWECVLEPLLFRSSSDLSIDFALSTGPPLTTESTVSNLLLKKMGVAHTHHTHTANKQEMRQLLRSSKPFRGKTPGPIIPTTTKTNKNDIPVVKECVICLETYVALCA